MQPAHRQQMRESGPAHRVRIPNADRALVSRRKRCRDAAATPRQPTRDVRGQPRPQSARRLARPRHADRREAASGRTEFGEPCHAREIVGARNSRIGRRHQSRADYELRARCHARRHIGRINVDANPWRQSALRIGREHHAHQATRRQRFDLQHPAGDEGDHRPGEHRRRHPLGAPPTEADPSRRGDPTDRECPRGASAGSDRRGGTGQGETRERRR